MRSIIPVSFLFLTVGCIAIPEEKSSDIAGHNLEDTAVPTDTAEDTATETGSVDSDTATEDSGTDTATADPCAFTIEGSDRAEYAVTTKLELSLNSESASGAIEAGSADILIVDATAVCGDVVMTGVYFYFSGSDAADTDWISEINNVVSGVSYDYDGHGTFEGFGMYSTRPVSYYDTQGPQRAVWELTFTEPIVIPEGTTFTYRLSIRMGGEDGLQPSSDDFFFANTMNYVSWYGTDNPSLYPETEIMPTAVGGVELTLENE